MRVRVGVQPDEPEPVLAGVHEALKLPRPRVEDAVHVGVPWAGGRRVCVVGRHGAREVMAVGRGDCGSSERSRGQDKGCWHQDHISCKELSSHPLLR